MGLCEGVRRSIGDRKANGLMRGWKVRDYECSVQEVVRGAALKWTRKPMGSLFRRRLCRQIVVEITPSTEQC